MISHLKTRFSDARWTIPVVLLLFLAAGPTRGATLEATIGNLRFEAGYPAPETVEKLYDELDFQRAV